MNDVQPLPAPWLKAGSRKDYVKGTSDPNQDAKLSYGPPRKVIAVDVKTSPSCFLTQKSRSGDYSQYLYYHLLLSLAKSTIKSSISECVTFLCPHLAPHAYTHPQLLMPGQTNHPHGHLAGRLPTRCDSELRPVRRDMRGLFH